MEGDTVVLSVVNASSSAAEPLQRIFELEREILRCEEKSQLLILQPSPPYAFTASIRFDSLRKGMLTVCSVFSFVV